MNNEKAEEKNKAWLERKWWYRLVKVIYTGVIALAIICVLFVAYENRPHVYTTDWDVVTIVCTNGYKFGVTTENRSYYNQPVLTDKEVLRFNNSCISGVLEEVPIGGFVPYNAKRNFALEGKELITGSWEEVFSILIGSSIGIGLFYLITKNAFTYIVLGKERVQTED